MPRVVLCVALVVLIEGVSAAADESIRVACIGDSITAGVGTQEVATESYPARLQALLGSGFRVGNFGHSGATLSRQTNRPYWKQPEFEKAREFRPNIVVIMLGTNDAHPDHWEKIRNEFVPTLKEMAGLFRGQAEQPKVYVCLPVPSFESRKENIECGVVPLVRQAGREADVPIIDLFNPLTDRASLFPDRLHPNAVGAALMAAIVCHAIDDSSAQKKNWKLVSADSEEVREGPAASAIDGRADTYWHTAYGKKTPKHPHELIIDLGATHRLFGVSYLPRQSGVNGRVRAYEMFAGLDSGSRGAPIATGDFTGRADQEFVFFRDPIVARYLTFRALSEINGGPWTSIAELDVLKTPLTPSTQPTHPHQRIIDPRRTLELPGLRILPGRGIPNGRIKGACVQAGRQPIPIKVEN